MRRSNKNKIKNSSKRSSLEELEAVNMDENVEESCFDFSANKMEPTSTVDMDQEEPDLTTVEVELTIDDHSIDLGEEPEHSPASSPKKNNEEKSSSSLANTLRVTGSDWSIGIADCSNMMASETPPVNDHINIMCEQNEKISSLQQSMKQRSTRIGHKIHTIINEDANLSTELSGFTLSKHDILECSEKHVTHCRPFAHKVRVRSRDKNYDCGVCGKCFNRNQNLQTHLRTHSGEKKYKCEECGKSFSESNTLKRHLRIHSGEKDYKCDECGKCFSQVSSLKRHIKIHTCEKDYECEECGKCFSVLDYLKTHLKMHSGERNYKCDECGKCFAVGNALNRHLRIHWSEKPYICKECGKGFNQRFNLVNHFKIHSREKDFKCEECGKCFAHGSYLKRHLRIHSGIRKYKYDNVAHVLDLVVSK